MLQYPVYAMKIIFSYDYFICTWIIYLDALKIANFSIEPLLIFFSKLSFGNLASIEE